MSISCEGILEISMWHLRVSGRTVRIQWNCLYWRICPRRTICMPQSTWLWAHWSPPQKFQMSLFLQVILYHSCVKISHGAATRSHVVTSAQAFMSLRSDLHYLVKVFHWTELYSTGWQGIHGSRTGELGSGLDGPKDRQRVWVSWSRWVGRISWLEWQWRAEGSSWTCDKDENRADTRMND